MLSELMEDIGYSHKYHCDVKDRGDYYEIELLWVLKKHRGQGLGIKALKEAIERHNDKPLRVRPCGFEGLTTEAVRGFYQYCGFVSVKQYPWMEYKGE